MIKAITQSEMVKNYAGAIAILLGALPAIGSLTLSIVTTMRGEPYAEKSWATLKRTVDEQSVMINAINLKIVKMEAVEEGVRLGKLQLELESLKNKLENKAIPVEPIKKCPAGKVLLNNECVTVSIAVKQKDDDKQKLDTTRKLIEQMKNVQKKPAMIKLQKLPLIPEGEG